MEKINWTNTAKAIRALGFRVSRDSDGEIRVGFKGNESAAYYTNDLEDALGTARAMKTEADGGAVPVSDAEGLAVESGEHIAGEPWDGAETPEPVAVEYETTPGGHEVRLNADYPGGGLYVIKCGGGVSCLGFARAGYLAEAVRNWIEDESNGEAPELAGLYLDGGTVYATSDAGTPAGYDFYMAAMKAGSEFNRRTGRRCPAELSPELTGKEGHRVRVLDCDGQEVSRFWVGRSTGWMPCHLEIARTDSHGGGAVYIPDAGRVETVRTA